MLFQLIMTLILNLYGLIQVINRRLLFLYSYFYWTDLFADGDDFSQETIDKNRNLYYQQQMVSRLFLYVIINFLLK